ncbi:MAG: hypothetical protein K0U93_09590 [Gammaproteobacteria bacterium]|nr:hypothetical protein [Gammaproteobacteria bacterium]
MARNRDHDRAVPPDPWSDDGVAEICVRSPATVEVAQEVAKANGAVLDRGASQPGTALLQVRINIANAQSRKILPVGVWTERRQEPGRLSRALVARARLKSTKIPQPCIVVLNDVAMESFQRRSRRFGHWPAPVHQAKQHVNSTGVPHSPFAEWWGLDVLFAEEPILASQEL